MKSPIKFLIIILLLVQSFTFAAKKNQNIANFSIFNGKFDLKNYDIKEFELFNDGKSFLIWFTDKKNKKDYIQVNNKIYGPFKIFNCPPIISKDRKKYAFGYEKNNKIYLRINNKLYGPLTTDFNYKCYFSNDVSRFAYKYEQGRNIFLKIDDKKYGPLKSDFYNVVFSFSDDGKNFAFSFKKDNLYYVQSNNFLLGPYDMVINLKFLGNDLFFMFDNDKKGFVKWGEKTYGPYDPFVKVITSKTAINISTSSEETDVTTTYISSETTINQGLVGRINNFHYFTYQLDGKGYVNVNSKEIGPFEGTVTGIGYSDKVENLPIIVTNIDYLEKMEPPSFYVYFKNQKYGPYKFPVFLELFPPIPIVSNDGSVLVLAYQDPNDNKVYIKFGDKNYGPYDNVYLAMISEENKPIFFYNIKNKDYLMLGDKILGPYDKIIFPFGFEFDSLSSVSGTETNISLEFFNLIGKVFVYKKNNLYYVNVNNKQYGPYDDIALSVKDDKNIYLGGIKGNKLKIMKINI